MVYYRRVLLQSECVLQAKADSPHKQIYKSLSRKDSVASEACHVSAIDWAIFSTTVLFDPNKSKHVHISLYVIMLGIYQVQTRSLVQPWKQLIFGVTVKTTHLVHPTPILRWEAFYS